MIDRAKLIELLGILPVKVAPEMAVLEAVDCGSYWRRTIEYAVEPGERIRAFLCVPKVLTGQVPAVYCFHQHGGNRLLGKSELVGLSGDQDQVYASELAKRGFVTLAPDAICFEDRCKDKELPDYAHLHELLVRLIRGQTLLGKVLHDITAGIDVLQAMAVVDKDRIGFIGHSYGGRAALFAPVFDHRIRASVCSCGSSNYRDMPGIQFDFVVPGILRYGDIEDVVRLVEPANLLILGGIQDERWSVGIEKMVQYAGSAFNDGVLEFGVYPCGHHFSKAMRERAYAFLGDHLTPISSRAKVAQSR
ncbi:MAG: acetylxylan esterase [Verrucomicrobiota bacterium]|nr:acetylxylan esterase [Verrucomicrobiota bacterium]